MRKMENDITVIVQARRGSGRFPNKILAPIYNKPMLYHIIRRLQISELVSRIIIATTCREEDKILKVIANVTHVNIFYGNETDVLDRYYQAATKFNAKNIVRITADSPVIDAEIIDLTIDKFNQGNFDYVSNWLNPTFPEGMSVEVFTFDSLRTAWNNANLKSEREHVTPYIWKNPEKFFLGEYTNYKNQSEFRVAVDYPEDLILIKKLYRVLYGSKPYFGISDIVKVLEQNPNWARINSKYQRLEGYKLSLKEDKSL
jgi:spore coat polysaccharide biosynthesis protein SpsF (cytidylyltransferase family)